MNQLQIKTKRVLAEIEKLTEQQLMTDEKESIATLLELHEVEPSAAAERISTSLNATGVFQVTHEQIYNLL